VLVYCGMLSVVAGACLLQRVKCCNNMCLITAAC